MKAWLQTIETKLDESLNKKAPSMPDGARKGLVGALWWIVLLVGGLQLWQAWRLWDVSHYEHAVDAVNRYYGYTVIENGLNFFFYAALVFLVIEVVLLLASSAGLKTFSKAKGWNLLFYAVLANVVYGLCIAFADVYGYGGFGIVVWTILSSVLVLYLIFQVRDDFTGSITTKPRPKAKAGSK